MNSIDVPRCITSTKVGNLYKTVRPPSSPWSMTRISAMHASRPSSRARAAMNAQPMNPIATSATPPAGKSPETCLTRAAQIAPPSKIVENPAI